MPLSTHGLQITMLIEIVKYFLSRADRNARQLGYLHEAIAIESRYKRVSRSWRPHVDATRDAISVAAEQCQHTNTVVIMGAGSLIDIPLEYLARTFDRVHLVDIVFTIGARLKIARFRNVITHVHDISGINTSLVAWDCRAPLPTLQDPVLPLAINKPDLLVSANILSQLAIVPRTYLEKTCSYQEQLLDQWCHELITKHLSFVRAQQCSACLVSDVRQDVYDSYDQTLLASEDMLYGHDLGTPVQEWLWELAPEGEIQAGHSIKAVVQFHLWN